MNRQQAAAFIIPGDDADDAEPRLARDGCLNDQGHRHLEVQEIRENIYTEPIVHTYTLQLAGSVIGRAKELASGVKGDEHEDRVQNGRGVYKPVTMARTDASRYAGLNMCLSASKVRTQGSHVGGVARVDD
jgi:hypothetical protein